MRFNIGIALIIIGLPGTMIGAVLNSTALMVIFGAALGGGVFLMTSDDD